MSKNFFALYLAIALCLTAAPGVNAYTGGGLPPGLDNPNSPVKVVCEIVQVNLPNNRTISIPKCKVVKNPDFQNDLKKRLDDFLARVRNGGN